MDALTDEQLSNYECALETIGNVIALKARDIAEKQAKLSPDTNRITELRRQQAELAGERSRLRIHDDDAVIRVIGHYGSLVRASLGLGTR
ncbi:hypothetical protein EXE55_05285 [Burkholderia glumae]|nr:hypothetical protein EXE55_05285 [Burkholderia glumae]